MSLNERCALEDFPENVEGEENGQNDIGRHEIFRAPIAFREYLPAVEEENEGEEEERGVRGVHAAISSEEQVLLAIDALRFASGIEPDVGNEDGDPGEERGGRSKGLEPAEDGGGARGDGHVCQETDGGRDGDTPDWDTLLRAVEQLLRRLAVLRQTEEIASAGVQERVGGRRS